MKLLSNSEICGANLLLFGTINCEMAILSRKSGKEYKVPMV